MRLTYSPATAFGSARVRSSQLAPPFGVAPLAADGEEILLEGVGVVGVSGGPFEGAVEAAAAVQVAGVASLLVPGPGGVGEVALHTQAVAIVVEPASQARPLAQQRLVRDLDGRLPGGGVAVEGQQPGRT